MRVSEIRVKRIRVNQGLGVTGCYKERVVNLSELKEKLDLPDFFSPM